MLRFAVHAQVERRPEWNMDTSNLGGERDPCGNCGCSHSGEHGGDHGGDHVGDHGSDHGGDIPKDVYDPEDVAEQMRKIIG